MIWIIVGLLVVWGLCYLLFAIVEPPAFLATYFKVPAIMVFLPDRLMVPVGRLFFGVICLVGAAVLAQRLIAAGMLPGQ